MDTGFPEIPDNPGTSSVIFDILGKANLGFHGVPLNTIKKAFFKGSNLAALLKMTVKGVTYDFTKTAQNGAVVFGASYGLWDFIAPDGRFHFSDYADLTVGETLLDMERILTDATVPAWDTFIKWIDSNLQSLNIDTSGVASCYISPIGNTADRVRANIISLDNMTDCVAFIRNVSYAVDPIKNEPLSKYVTSDTSFGITVICRVISEDTGVEEDLFSMSFQFRQ